MPADEDYDPEAYVIAPLTPLIESPPIEPVEPPLPRRRSAAGVARPPVRTGGVSRRRPAPRS